MNVHNSLSMRYIKGLLAAGLVLVAMAGLVGMSDARENGLVCLANSLIVITSIVCFTWLLVAEGRKPNP